MGDDATRSHAACKATLAGVPCALEEGHRGRHRIADNRGPCHCGFYHSSADPAYDLTGHREPHATPDRAATLEEAADRFEELLESWGYNRLEIARLTRTVIYGE